MSVQLDFLERSGLDPTPETGRTQPRLWIRRLVIWEKPGVLLREVVLKPGLNVVWSPDPADLGGLDSPENGLGHGSGKTLFCRLLRYVLGEESFAPDTQRYRIAQEFPEGLVGAEIVVDGTQWSILRPLGLNREHFALPDVDLNHILERDFTATGIAPFLTAVERTILSEEVVALIPVGHQLQGWLVALAWLSRDQECRFDKVLDWRSSDSESGSPARGLSATKLLDALRALIGAIDPQESKLRAEIGEMDGRQKEAAQEALRYGWEADRLRLRLISDLGLNPDEVLPGRLAVEQFTQAAKANLARLSAVTSGNDMSELMTLRAIADEEKENLENLKLELSRIEARIPEIEHLIRRIKGERPASSIELDNAENPLCPLCDVPINHVLVAGCKLSEKLPDLDAAKARLKQLDHDLEVENRRLQYSKNEQSKITLQLGPARAHAEKLRHRVSAAERAQESRSDAWFKTRRLIDEAQRLGESLLVQEKKCADSEILIEAIEDKRSLAAAFRDAQADVFLRLSSFFDAIIHELVGSNAGGRVTLDGNGLRLSVEFEGDRSTAAIDSLKVIAFDLAVMCMSIEGKTRLPAFLIHDSPREADLGLSVYHRLFHLVQHLDQKHESPLFQYIVTTTTRPPEGLSGKPWLCEKLGGAPAAARLLKRDL